MFDLSIFNNDGTLGRSPNDPAQLPPVCNCLVGTPRIDAEGNCNCDGSPVGPLSNFSGPREIVNHVVQYIEPWRPLRPEEGARPASGRGDFTIFGFSPLTIALVAGGGFFLWSAMSDDKKTRAR